VRCGVAASLVVAVGCRVHFDDVAVDAHLDAAATPAVIAYAQTAAAWNMNGMMATTITLPNPVVAHDAIIVAMSVATNAVTLDAITDTAGNTYAIVLGPVEDAGSRAYIALAMDVAPGPTAVTAFLSATPNSSLELFANEYANIARTAAFDDSSFGIGMTFGLDAMQSGLVTTRQAGELLYAYGLGPCVHAGSGLDLRTDYHGDVTEDLIVGAGPHQMTATATCPATGNHWQLLAASFVAAPESP
jgi:hypothetical protein